MLHLEILIPIFQSQGINSSLVSENTILLDGVFITISDNSIYGKNPDGKVFSISYINGDIFSFLNAWQQLQVMGSIKKPLINTTDIESAYFSALHKLQD